MFNYNEAKVEFDVNDQVNYNYYYLNQKARNILKNHFLRKNIKVLGEITCLAKVGYYYGNIWYIDIWNEFPVEIQADRLMPTRTKSPNRVSLNFGNNIFPIQNCVWKTGKTLMWKPKNIISNTDEFNGTQYNRDLRMFGIWSLSWLLNDSAEVLVIS